MKPLSTRPGGFTLLELLVALAIMGLILAFYGGSQRFMVQAVERQSAGIATADDRATTARTLRRLLEAIQPPLAPATPQPGAPPAFEAGPHSLRFVTLLPGSDDPVDARLSRDGAGRLMLYWSPVRHVRPLAPPGPPTATEIAAGISSLDLSYWRAGTWTSALPPGQLPGLIRLRVVPQRGAPGADLVVAPRQDPSQ